MASVTEAAALFRKVAQTGRHLTSSHLTREGELSGVPNKADWLMEEKRKGSQCGHQEPFQSVTLLLTSVGFSTGPGPAFGGPQVLQLQPDPD